MHAVEARLLTLLDLADLAAGPNVAGDVLVPNPASDAVGIAADAPNVAADAPVVDIGADAPPVDIGADVLIGIAADADTGPSATPAAA